MTIQEAIEAAEKSNESCIRRPIGVMRVRIIRLPQDSDGILLMAETCGPLSGVTPAIHYALTPEDVLAANWSVASGVKLERPAVSAENNQSEPELEDRLDAACGHICDLIAEYDPEGANPATVNLLADLSGALEKISAVRCNFVATCGNSMNRKPVPGFIPEEGAKNDSQQEAGK